MTSMVFVLAAVAVNPGARHFLTDHPAAAHTTAPDGHLTHASGFLAETGAHDAESAARSFLGKYEDEFGVGSEGLELRGVPELGRSGAVKFARTIGGMQLFGGDVTVGVDERHRVFLVNSGSSMGFVSGSTSSASRPRTRRRWRPSKAAARMRAKAPLSRATAPS
jgi:hypothetical protein